MSETCGLCDGAGSFSDGDRCPRCGGEGKVDLNPTSTVIPYTLNYQPRPTHADVFPCPLCRGEGVWLSVSCQVCRGNGVLVNDPAIRQRANDAANAIRRNSRSEREQAVALSQTGNITIRPFPAPNIDGLMLSDEFIKQLYERLNTTIRADMARAFMPPPSPEPPAPPSRWRQLDLKE